METINPYKYVICNHENGKFDIGYSESEVTNKVLLWVEMGTDLENITVLRGKEIHPIKAV